MDRPERQPSTAAGLLATAYLLASLAASLYLLWTLIPEHQRIALRMRLLRSSGRAMRAAARRAGDSSLSLEIATADPELGGGVQAYDLPLWLSLGADRCEHAYDRTRGAL
jgi:hypothetical protein